MCQGVDRDSSTKCAAATDFEPNRKVAKTFQAGMVIVSVIPALKGQRQDEFEASVGCIEN